MRILRAAEGARPALFGFERVNDAGACVAAIIAAGIIPVALEYMDRPAIQICEAFAHAGYPLDVEAMLIVGGGRVRPGNRRHAPPHRCDRRALSPQDHQGVPIGGGERRHLEGPQVRLRRNGAGRRLHLHGRHHPDRPIALRARSASTRSPSRRAWGSPTCSMRATATSIRW